MQVKLKRKKTSFLVKNIFKEIKYVYNKVKSFHDSSNNCSMEISITLICLLISPKVGHKPVSCCRCNCKLPAWNDEPVRDFIQLFRGCLLGKLTALLIPIKRHKNSYVHCFIWKESFLRRWRFHPTEPADSCFMSFQELIHYIYIFCCVNWLG